MHRDPVDENRRVGVCENRENRRITLCTAKKATYKITRKKQFVNLLQTFFEFFYILRLDCRQKAGNLSPSRRKIGKSATHPAKGEVMYYQPRVIDKDGKLKAGIAAIEAATGLKKSVIVAKLIREGLKKATKATPELKDIIEKED